jgi:nitroreductase
MPALGGLRRKLYLKACALLGKVPKGRQGGFEPFSRPSEDIPHFVSFNPKVRPYHTISKAILKAQVRILSHFLARKIERDYFEGRPIEPNCPPYIQVQDRINFLRRIGVDVEKEADLAGIVEINRLYEVFVQRGKSEVHPPHRPLSSSEIETLDSILRSRRTVRCWTDQAVSRDTIEDIVQSALWAPSTGNFQPVRFIVVDDEEVKSRITTGGFAGRRVPVIIAVAVDERVYPSASIGNKSQDAAAAIQNFLLKAHALGLGAAWISGKSVNDARVREALCLPAYVESVAFIYLGWPANTPITPPRVNAREVIYYNKYEEEPPCSATTVSDAPIQSPGD